VVEVRVEPHWVILRQHLAQLGRDPLGQRARGPAPYPDDLDMVNRFEPLDDILEELVRDHQGVAT
jgi:hypothetical protein